MILRLSDTTVILGSLGALHFVAAGRLPGHRFRTRRALDVAERRRIQHFVRKARLPAEL